MRSIFSPPQRALCASLGLVAFSAAAFAGESRDHLNVQEVDRPGYLPAASGEPFRLPPVDPSPVLPPGTGLAADSAGAIRVDRIVFRGNTVVPAADLDAIAAPYAGRTVGAPELENLRQRLTRHYVDLGYVNSGVLLSKEGAEVVGGTLVFDVVEGRLTTIRLRGMDGLDDGYVARRLAGDSDGPLNMDRLRERYQLLLGDPLFQRMNARLIPDVNLGEAVLDIDVQRAKPYQVSFFANNYRPPSIGSESLGISGWLRNLTGQGDFLEASAQTPHNSAADPRVSLAWRTPIGQQGTQISAAIDHGRSSVIEEPMQALGIRSILDTADLGISQSLVETLSHKLVLGINHVNRANRTTLLGSPFSFNPGEPDGVTKEVLWRFWQEYTYRSETQVLALRSIFSSGKNNLQDIPDLPPNSGVTTPQKRYQVWLGQAQYARQVLENGAQAIVRGSVQRSEEKLLPLDGMSIGGVYTVRGYRENQLIRDNGEMFSLEFEYPLLAKSANGPNLSLAPFYDRGRGYNRHEPVSTLSSWGVAGKLRWQGFSLDLAVARRLSHPDSVKSGNSNLQDRGVHFNLSYVF
ncbi:MAG: ShlB/FhaC/HecB family hemolysin secretion/activation protein [Betaproteobacteria bacterium]|nr:ShlB/FhaC/HecB family hemolysin secretion/activation protein [Betaproteobacteria bacterium]